jgi:hypothetical protein
LTGIGRRPLATSRSNSTGVKSQYAAARARFIIRGQSGSVTAHNSPTDTGEHIAATMPPLEQYRHRI